MPKFIKLDGEFYSVDDIVAVYKDYDKWYVDLRGRNDGYKLTDAQYDKLARALQELACR